MVRAAASSGYVMRSIDHVRDAYGAAVARLVRISVIGIVMVAVAGAGIFALGKFTPTGFLPEDDQGALFVVVQLPGGASVARTTDVVERAEAILQDEPAVEDVTSVIGLNFIDSYSQSNVGFHGRHAQAVRGAQGSSRSGCAR